MRDIFIFILSFITPFIYYRLLFIFLRKRIFEKPINLKEGIQMHHLHYGVIVILVSAMVLLLYGKNIYVIILQGLGLGLILDEFLGSLKIVEDRPVGLKIYGDSFLGTFVLFLSISIILLICGYLLIM